MGGWTLGYCRSCECPECVEERSKLYRGKKNYFRDAVRWKVEHIDGAYRWLQEYIEYWLDHRNEDELFSLGEMWMTLRRCYKGPVEYMDIDRGEFKFNASIAAYVGRLLVWDYPELAEYTEGRRPSHWPIGVPDPIPTKAEKRAMRDSITYRVPHHSTNGNAKAPVDLTDPGSRT